MRTLVVGAGMAGLSLAARLCQQGRPPVVVERAMVPDGGFAIGLYPLGSCVLHGLGLYDRLVSQAEPLHRYVLADATGNELQAFDMSVLTAALGPMLMIGRAELARLLEGGCSTADVRWGVTVVSLAQDADGVDAIFDDGTVERFDAVVACDGVRSSVRESCFGTPRVFDTGWVLWTWWVDPSRFEPGVAREWWGGGAFFGAYPAPGRVMCAAGGPGGVPEGDDPRPALRRHLARTIDHVPPVRTALDEIEGARSWRMRDVRASRWVDGRVALCGDAAVGFLPTAGVGASNAMRAAAALADELSRANGTTVPLALELYEKRCRGVVERNQTDSRRLARMMFVRRPTLARLRDQLARRYPADRMLGRIIASMRQPF